MIAHPNDIPAAFAAAYNSGDVEALLALYAEDAVFVPDGVAEVSGPGIRQALEGFMKLEGPIEMKLERAVVGPEVAVVIAKWSLPTPDGAVLTGITSDVVEKQSDGGWRYTIDAPFGVKA